MRQLFAILLFMVFAFQSMDAQIKLRALQKAPDTAMVITTKDNRRATWDYIDSVFQIPVSRSGDTIWIGDQYFVDSVGAGIHLQLHWDSIQGMPSGFLDGIDNVGDPSSSDDFYRSEQLLRTDDNEVIAGGYALKDSLGNEMAKLLFYEGEGIVMDGFTGVDGAYVRISVDTNLLRGIIHWDSLQGIPADIADGDDVGITTEQDTSALARIDELFAPDFKGALFLNKNGALIDQIRFVEGQGINIDFELPYNYIFSVDTSLLMGSTHWDSIQGIPADIADGDNIGDPTDDELDDILRISQNDGVETFARGFQFQNKQGAVIDKAWFSQGDGVLMDWDTRGGITGLRVSIDSSYIPEMDPVQWGSIVGIPADIADGDEYINSLFIDPFSIQSNSAELTMEYNFRPQEKFTFIAQDGLGIQASINSLAFKNMQADSVRALYDSLKGPVDWNDLTSIPADIADGDQVDDADSDPTNELQNWDDIPGIPADIADGDQVDDADNDPTNELQNWSNIPGIPADIADGDQVDDADNDPTNELQSWSEIPDIPADIADGDDEGPVIWQEVGNGGIYYNSGNVGIGNSTPEEKLHLSFNSQLTNGMLIQKNNVGNANNLVLDNSIMGSGVSGSSAPGNATLLVRQGGKTPAIAVIHKDGSDAFLVDGFSNIGIGISQPTSKLDVNGYARIRSHDLDNTLTKIAAFDANGVLHYREASSLGGSGSTSWNDLTDIPADIADGDDVGDPTDDELGDILRVSQGDGVEIFARGFQFQNKQGGLIDRAWLTQGYGINLDWDTRSGLTGIKVEVDTSVIGGEGNLWSQGTDGIYYDGNVGIGTDSPMSELEMRGDWEQFGTIYNLMEVYADDTTSVASHSMSIDEFGTPWIVLKDHPLLEENFPGVGNHQSTLSSSGLRINKGGAIRLQVSGTGYSQFPEGIIVGENSEPNTFKFIDGNEENGKILYSDSDGYASWDRPMVSRIYQYRPTVSSQIPVLVTWGVVPVSIANRVESQTNADFSAANNGATCNFDGRVRVSYNIRYTSTSINASVESAIALNGNVTNSPISTSYISNQNANNTATLSGEYILTVADGDVISFETRQESNSTANATLAVSGTNFIFQRID